MFSTEHMKNFFWLACSPATSESYFVLTNIALEQLWWGGKNPALTDPSAQPWDKVHYLQATGL